MASKTEELRILLTGGGSAGHVSPLLAVADAIREIRNDSCFLYVGVRQGLEAEVVPRNDIAIRFAPSVGMPSRKFSLRMIRFLLTLGIGMLKATAILLSFRPHVIVASGGFASAPAVFASALLRLITFGALRIPVYIHEQNAVPGRMNLAAGRLAAQIGLAHEHGGKGFPSNITEYVGYPVRAAVRKITREEARRRLDLQDGEEYLVVFGGSQGARTINHAIVDALPHLAGRENLRIIHASGTLKSGEYDASKDTETRLAGLDSIPSGYTRVDYLHDMPVHVAASDLAVIRAGAGSLLEICAGGIPAIAIPKANLPGDSQVANARELAAKGAVELLYEEPSFGDEGLIEEVPGKTLASKITDLLDDPERCAALAENARSTYDPDAANRIAQRVIALATGEKIAIETISVKTEEIARQVYPAFVNPTVLRRGVERTLDLPYEQAFAHGRIEDERLQRLDDLDYLRYRGAALLVLQSWCQRNEGIKLLGLTRHCDRLDLLLHVLTDSTPASRMHRLLGGDFYYVGFERRNALASLALMELWDSAIQEAVIFALDDPYYEVRSAAVKFTRTVAAGKAAGNVEIDGRLVDGVRSLTDEHSLEVRVEALHTLGWIAEPAEVMEECAPYLMDRRVLIREAVLLAFHALLNREGTTGEWADEIRHQLDRFLLTSVAVYPHFPLKEHYSTLQRRLNGEEDA